MIFFTVEKLVYPEQSSKSPEKGTLEEAKPSQEAAKEVKVPQEEVKVETRSRRVPIPITFDKPEEPLPKKGD